MKRERDRHEQRDKDEKCVIIFVVVVLLVASALVSMPWAVEW